MPGSYSTAFRWIHWLMAVILGIMVIFGMNFDSELPDEERSKALMVHSSLGVTFLLLVFWRLMMRISGKAKRPYLRISPVQKILASIVQFFLYILMIYVPIAGLVTAIYAEFPIKLFGLFNLAVNSDIPFETVRTYHEIGIWTLVSLTLIHVGAALMHKFVFRDAVLSAMTSRNNKDDFF